MYIYLITNKINNKFYVGKTKKSIQERFKEHITLANQGNITFLYNAIRKYGKENFEIQYLATAINEEQLNKLEMLWIKILNATELGYNMTLGGEGATPTEYLKNKIRETFKKYRNSPEGKQTHLRAAKALSKKLKGVPKSINHKNKIAASWTCERRHEKSNFLRNINKIQNAILKDYTCPKCGKEFKQINKGTYGGHRKACLKQ
jgi:group I intron endonuclease